MNKEIKDLIEQLSICSVNDYNFEIYGDDAKILDEYITNLQQENQQLKEKYLNAVADYESEKSKNHNAIEHINKFEDIKAYYSYEEDGYEEYNYDEDFKIDLLEILEGGD